MATLTNLRGGGSSKTEGLIRPTFINSVVAYMSDLMEDATEFRGKELKRLTQ